MEGAATLEAVRWTARASLVIFSLAFASWGLSPTAWPARRRSGLLRTLALSHGVHLAAVAALARQTRGASVADNTLVTTLGGMLAYAVIFWGAWRPASAFVRWGAFWVWTVFLISYLPRAIEAPAAFGPAVALLAAALLVRLRHAVRGSRSTDQPVVLPKG
jgi:hypothetical protein